MDAAPGVAFLEVCTRQPSPVPWWLEAIRAVYTLFRKACAIGFYCRDGVVCTATNGCVVASLVMVGLVLLARVPALADEPATPLTTMTYNIGAYSPTIPLGPAEMAQIAQEIKDAQADVVGMTEVDVGTRNGTA